MKQPLTLTDSDLPDVWRVADTESGKGQRLALRLTIAKAGGGVLAALGGAISIGEVGLAVGAWIILVGFVAALASEVVSWIFQPERAWYDGRAVAESVKTLSWRYSICAEPFLPTLAEPEATDLLRRRVDSVTAELSEQIEFTGDNPVVTPGMNRLREQPFVLRRDAYIEGRTKEQQSWYAWKAKFNRNQSRTWRVLLIFTEIAAVALALAKIVGGWPVDYAGLLGAAIAAGAAWVAVKQFSPLASAYSVASKELAIQADKLRTVEEEDWALVAADAEEAISREHTTWLASRTGITRRLR
ncbi:DUF4231 domain-containing protein [Gulosibacter sp. 10]|uniref:DUF4231 domain-containing protein n=1 Tax=Gulosibacter sp. 10 TaxID=1255570 RepID=UPI000B3632B0|nr:DUF4231 domain-containing protein [Gulosibacter sp. 10]